MAPLGEAAPWVKIWDLWIILQSCGLCKIVLKYNPAAQSSIRKRLRNYQEKGPRILSQRNTKFPLARAHIPRSLPLKAMPLWALVTSVMRVLDDIAEGRGAPGAWVECGTDPKSPAARTVEAGPRAEKPARTGF